MGTRAVHLEVVSDLSTVAFIRCLRRFVARRGIPSLLSDNAKTFRAAEEWLNRNQVQNFLTTRRISWNFIPEKAPWMGGFYERLVASVKSSLRKTLGRVVPETKF
jgi:hypothetical protein